MLKITQSPPAHSVDDVPTYIAGNDTAWDIERIKADRAKLPDGVKHPLDVYYECGTRYSLDALITVPEQLREPDGPDSVTVSHYMLPKARPTRFELRSVGGRDWQIAYRAFDTQGPYEFAKRGLVRVCDVEGPEGKPTTFTPQRDADGIVDAWLDDVSRTDRHLLDGIGLAVFRLSKNEVGGVEGKP